MGDRRGFEGAVEVEPFEGVRHERADVGFGKHPGAARAERIGGWGTGQHGSTCCRIAYAAHPQFQVTGWRPLGHRRSRGHVPRGYDHGVALTHGGTRSREMKTLDPRSRLSARGLLPVRYAQAPVLDCRWDRLPDGHVGYRACGPAAVSRLARWLRGNGDRELGGGLPSGRSQSIQSDGRMPLHDRDGSRR
jgi:hypothetical protein